MEHVADEDLALLALDEAVPGAQAHLADCSRCRAELAGLRDTVRIARAADLGDVPAPPGAVWDRISAELGLAVVATPARPAPRRRAWASIAAGLALVLGVGIAVSWGAGGRAPATPSSALAPVTGGPAGGDVRLTAAAGGEVLEVSTHDLPATAGYYQVWLLDPQSARMVALGALDGAGRARLAVPRGVALVDYPTVDVSDEPHDGDTAHSGRSLLRAPRPT